jgi:hypothetical protein
MWRHARIAVAGIVGAYVLVLAALFVLMRRPPMQFALTIAKVPGPFFSLVPFRQVWILARAGQLRVGDPAPDFCLETLDRKGQMRLSSFRGEKPVVLVFGSYT